MELVMKLIPGLAFWLGVFHEIPNKKQRNWITRNYPAGRIQYKIPGTRMKTKQKIGLKFFPCRAKVTFNVR